MSRDFDGVDDVISCGSASAINDFTSLTISVWVNADNSGEAGEGRIFDKNLTTINSGQILSFFDSGTEPAPTLFYNRGFSLGTGQWYLGGAVSTGNWMNIAMTYAAVNTTSQPIFYVNLSQGSTTTNVAPKGVVGSDNIYSLRFGSNSSGTRSFNGRMAYFHYYNRVLTKNEISQIARFPGSITNGLRGFLPLWGGTPENDYSGYGNTGTITGAIFSIDNPPVNRVFGYKRSRLWDMSLIPVVTTIGTKLSVLVSTKFSVLDRTKVTVIDE